MRSHSLCFGRHSKPLGREWRGPSALCIPGKSKRIPNPPSLTLLKPWESPQPVFFSLSNPDENDLGAFPSRPYVSEGSRLGVSVWHVYACVLNIHINFSYKHYHSNWKSGNWEVLSWFNLHWVIWKPCLRLCGTTGVLDQDPFGSHFSVRAKNYGLSVSCSTVWLLANISHLFTLTTNV